MTDRIDEIRARCEAATRGPWRTKHPRYGGDDIKIYDNNAWAKGLTPFAVVEDDGIYSNADFIAHAREDIPWLLAEVGRLKEINKALKSDNYNAEMNLSHLAAIIQEYEEGNNGKQ